MCRKKIGDFESNQVNEAIEAEHIILALIFFKTPFFRRKMVS
jgi:hypothetical protein